MSTEVIRSTQSAWAASPDAAKGTPTVTARLVDGQAELNSGSYTWRADLPGSLGGKGSAPSPTQLLLGALAGCAVAFIHDTLAPQLDIELRGVSAVARCRTDARGLLGMEDASPDLADIELEITVDAVGSEERLRELEQVWRDRCPIYLAITKPNAISLRVSRGEAGPN